MAQPVPLGQALSLANGDTYLLTENEIVLLEPTASGNPLGVIHATGGALFTLDWSPDGRLSQSHASIGDPATSTFRNAACPGRMAESCDFDDHDCDGFSQAFMCCPFSFASDDLPLNSTEPLDGNWLVVQGDEGPISAVSYTRQAELHNLIGGVQSCLGCWPAGSKLTHLSRAGAVMVMSGQVTGNGSEHTCPASCSTAAPLPSDSDDDPSPPGDDDDDMNVMQGDAAIQLDAQMEMSMRRLRWMKRQPHRHPKPLYFGISRRESCAPLKPHASASGIESFREVGGAVVWCTAKKADMNIAFRAVP